MSYPYVTDALNAIFGTQWHLPIPTFGVIVALAVTTATYGARVFDIFDNADRFVANPLSVILTRTGFSIYGGLCFGILAGVIFVRRRSIPVSGVLGTLRTKRFWTKVGVSAGVLTALAACAPR